MRYYSKIIYLELFFLKNYVFYEYIILLNALKYIIIKIEYYESYAEFNDNKKLKKEKYSVDAFLLDYEISNINNIFIKSRIQVGES